MNIRAVSGVTVVALSALLAGCWGSLPPTMVDASSASQRAVATVVRDEFMIPSRDAGISLYVRNVRRGDISQFAAHKVVICVHGATYPAHTAFDLRLDGLSWAEFMAARGYDVYTVDLRGYGKSTRPPEMSKPASEGGPIVENEVAVSDITAAVDWVRARRNVQRVNLIGWSWGTTLVAMYTARNPERVERLTMYAPQWLRSGTSPIAEKLPTFRTVTREQSYERWINGVPANQVDRIIPKGWFDTWADATFAIDPDGAKLTPPVLRAPNGAMASSRLLWSDKNPHYNPADIRVPTLIVVGEWDRDTPPIQAQTLFPLLTNAPTKRMVHLARATHTVMLERNRMELFNTVQTFLDEAAPR